MMKKNPHILHYLKHLLLKCFVLIPSFDDDTQDIIWHNLRSSDKMKMLGLEIDRGGERENKQIKNISQS